VEPAVGILVWPGEELRRRLIRGVAHVRRTPPRYGAAPVDGGKMEMAQKVTVVLEDDLTGGPAEHTIRFAFEAPATRST
jgi:hypothetical protein